MANDKKDKAKAKSGKPKQDKVTPKKAVAQVGGETIDFKKAGANKQVAQLRGKLTEAMQDPLTRDQIVRAIRALMQEK